MKLLEKFQSEELSLKNRVVMAPMTRCRADNEGNVATDLIAQYYAQRASAGLLITEGTFINERASGYINVPCIYTDDQVEGWKKVTAAVHQAGGKIFAQLWHVGRLSHPDLLNGKSALGPSAINGEFTCYTKEGFKETITPQEMTIADIAETIKDFQQAAVNAIAAGFDGVEIHAANGYLFHQFFAKCANVRTDEYGGSIAKRLRFLFEVLDAITDKIGDSRVAVRIAPSLDQTFGIVLDNESEALYDILVSKLNDYKLAYLHISGFTQASIENPLKLVIETAKHFRSIYQGTLMVNKGFDAITANQVITDGIADLVSFGEVYIGNPDLVERFAADAPLNRNDRTTYYTGGAKGFTDYGFL
jgi:N-ethylmaleimide reductase